MNTKVELIDLININQDTITIAIKAENVDNYRKAIYDAASHITEFSTEHHISIETHTPEYQYVLKIN